MGMGGVFVWFDIFMAHSRGSGSGEKLEFLPIVLEMKFFAFFQKLLVGDATLYIILLL